MTEANKTRRAMPLSQRAKLAGAGSVIALMVASQAHAADPAPAPGSTVDEVIVTANKREELINKVGATITAFSGAAIAERKIVTLADLAAAVPSLSFAESTFNTPILTLRGVGYNSDVLGSFPAVTAYADQAPMPFPVYVSHSTYDLERIEVLKGPQGTVFGENSTGGAINFVAAAPTSGPEAGGDVTYGRFNDIEGEAYISGPLSDNLRARLAVNGENMDGWQYSVTRPGDTMGAKHYVAGRLLLDWTPSNTVRFSLNLNGWKDTSQPQAGQFAGLFPQVSFGIHPVELTAPFSAGNPQSADWPSGPIGSLTSAYLARVAPRSSRDFFQGSLRADVDLTDAITLTSLTTYDRFTEDMTSDSDGTDLDITAYAPIQGNLSTFNEEVRLSNEKQTDSSMRWVGGATYEHDHMYEIQNPIWLNDSVNNPAYFNIFEDFQYTRQNVNQYAVFGNVEDDVTSRLTAKAGFRYTNSSDTATLCAGGDAADAAITNFLGELYSGGASFPPVVAGPPACGMLGAGGIPTTLPVTRNLTESNVSWRFGVDYKISGDTLAYFNVSRGYKAGSFPTLAITAVSQTKPVTQESVTAYEGGVKLSLLDQAVHVNAAAFYYDYVDKQVLGLLSDPIYGLLNELVNIPKSAIYGFDGDVTVHPVHGLTISAAVTYLQSRIDAPFNSYNPLAEYGNLAGNRLPFVPTWDFSLNADYRFELPNGGAPFAGLTLQGKTAMDTQLAGGTTSLPLSTPGVRDFQNDVHPFTTNDYATLDLRLGYESPNGSWKLMLFGRNVLNKYYWTNVATLSDGISRFAGMPATYGVTLSAKFR